MKYIKTENKQALKRDKKTDLRMPKIHMPTMAAMTEMLRESGYEGGDVNKLLESMGGGRVGRGISGYMMWLNENREKIKTEYFEDEELKGKEKVTKIAKKGGELWKGLEEEEREEWNAKARESRGSVKPKEKKILWEYSCTKEDDVETPEDMSGPFVGYALVGRTSVGYVRGKGSFSSLSDALKAGREVDGCVGVTKGEGGYQLRAQEKLNKVTKEYFKDHVKSWVFGTKTLEELTGKKESGKKKVSKILKKVEEKKEDNEKKKELMKKKAEAAKKKEAMKKKKEEEMEALKKKMEELAKKAAEEDEDEEEEESEIENNDEESEDEEVELETWIYNEEEYWVDGSTNEVYDVEQNVIGKRVEKDGHYLLEKN